MNLFETGTLLRCPGGNVETIPQQVAAGVKWAALNLGDDPCVKRDPTVWNHQRKLYTDAGIPHAPWMHCHSLADIDFVLSVAKVWDSPFVGINLEDVVSDNLSLEAVGRVLRASGLPVHLPTLGWVQNGQPWHFVDFAVFALEMFPEAPGQQPYLDEWEKCIDHAFAEGAKKVTLLFSTQSPRSVYPNVAHCLYTADNVLSSEWPSWKDTVPQPIPVPPTPEVPVSKVPYPRPLILGDQGIDVEGLGRALCKTGFYVTLTQFGKAGQAWRRTYGAGKRDAVNKLRAQVGWQRTGQYNLAVHDLMEKRGYFDAKAIDLISKYEPPKPPPGDRIHAAITDYCLRAEANEENWHYTQSRPFHIQYDPENTTNGDCSAYVIMAYAFAKRETGLNIPDPGGYNYSGYGNTWDDLDGHPRVSAPYQVGDLAHYEGHVSICRKPGSAGVAIFSSFGSESGPKETNVNYRSDLRFVCRPGFS